MDQAPSSEQEKKGARVAGVMNSVTERTKSANILKILDLWHIDTVYEAFPLPIRPTSLGTSAIQALKSIATRISLPTAQQKFMEECVGSSEKGPVKVGFQHLNRIQGALLEQERQNDTPLPTSKGRKPASPKLVKKDGSAPNQSQSFSLPTAPSEKLNESNAHGLSSATKPISFEFKEDRVVSDRQNGNIKGVSSSRTYDTIPSASNNERHPSAPVAPMYQKEQDRSNNLSTTSQTQKGSAQGSFTWINSGIGENPASFQSSKGQVPMLKETSQEKNLNDAKMSPTTPYGTGAKNNENLSPSIGKTGTLGSEASRVSFKIPKFNKDSGSRSQVRNADARNSVASSIKSVSTDIPKATEDSGSGVQVKKKASEDTEGSKPVKSSTTKPPGATNESVKVDKNKARNAINAGDLCSSKITDLNLPKFTNNSGSSGAVAPLVESGRPAGADPQGSNEDSSSSEETMKSAAVEIPLAEPAKTESTSNDKNEHVTLAGSKGSRDNLSLRENTPHYETIKADSPKQDTSLATDFGGNTTPQSMVLDLPTESLKLSTEVELTPAEMMAEMQRKVAMWAQQSGEEAATDLKRKASSTISPARVLKASRPNPANPLTPISVISKEDTPTTFLFGPSSLDCQTTDEEKPETNADALIAKFRNAVRLLEQTRSEIKNAPIDEGNDVEVQLRKGLEKSMNYMIRHGEGDLELEIECYERDRERKLGF